MKRIRTAVLPVMVMIFPTACGGKPDAASGSGLEQGIRASEEAVTAERNDFPGENCPASFMCMVQRILFTVSLKNSMR